MWVGNPGTGRTVGYDFGTTVSMVQLVVTNGIGMGGGAGQHVFAFDFQYSADGATWVTALSVPASARATTDGATYSYGLEAFTLSGVVTDAAGNHAARKIVAIREDTNAVSGVATSNASTGAYTIQAGAAVPHTLTAYPASGEDLPALVLRGVVPA